MLRAVLGGCDERVALPVGDLVPSGVELPEARLRKKSSAPFRPVPEGLIGAGTCRLGGTPNRGPRRSKKVRLLRGLYSPYSRVSSEHSFSDGVVAEVGHSARRTP